MSTNKSLNEKTLNELKQTFELFDKDKNGRITADELADVLKALGQNPSPAEIKNMIASVDKDNNGTVEFAEFVELMTPSLGKPAHPLSIVLGTASAPGDDDVKAAFKVFDRDGDGFITPTELKKALHAMGQNASDKEVEEMIKAADTNKDGKITFDEFKKMFAQ